MQLSPVKNIKTKECRFVTYVPSPDGDRPDLHVVKEIIHYDDGTSEPALDFRYDYERPAPQVIERVVIVERPAPQTKEYVVIDGKAYEVVRATR